VKELARGRIMRLLKLALVFFFSALMAACSSSGGGDGGAGANTKATAIVLETDAFGLLVGASYNLSATVLPATVADTHLMWTSDNLAVATVDEYGTVTGIAAGVAHITATSDDGSVAGTATVTVSAQPVAATGISIIQSSVSVVAGAAAPLTADIAPPTATNPNVVWASSDPTIATVSANGVVMGVAAGSTVVTATTVDGGFVASVPVTVQAAPQPLYSVSVQVTGLVVGKLVLLNNAADGLVLNQNGTFVFPNKTTTYSVTVQDQPLGFQYCKVTNGTGTATADVSIAVTCGMGNPQTTTLTVTNSSDGTPVSFKRLYGLALDADANLYAADWSGYKVWKIAPSGVATTLAGSGTSGTADGTGSAATFYQPTDLTIDVAANLYVGDKVAIRKVTQAGVVSTIANSTAWRLENVTVGPNGNLYVGSGDPPEVLQVAQDGSITALAGSPTAGSADGTGVNASFNYPSGVSYDATTGNLYVADYRNNKVRVVTQSGVVTTLAGSGTSGSSDGIGAGATFSGPFSLTVDPTGSIFVSDWKNGMIRRILPSGVVSTVITSQSWKPEKIAIDKNGTLYVTTDTNVIVKLVPGP
jgi:sugar lactone lactonase YvrE